MTEERKTRHASRQALIRYSLGELPDEKMAELEDHIAECDTCAVRSAGMRRMMTIFDRLAPAAASYPARVAERIWAAIPGSREAVSGVVGLVGLKIGEAVPSLSAKEYAGMIPPSSPFAKFTLAGSAGEIRTRGAVRARGRRKRTAMKAGGPAGQPKCTVVAAGEATVMVRVERWAQGNPPLCLIMPERSGGPFPLQVVEWEERGPVLLARREVPPGTYIVALVEAEPGETGSP